MAILSSSVPPSTSVLYHDSRATIFLPNWKPWQVFLGRAEESFSLKGKFRSMTGADEAVTLDAFDMATQMGTTGGKGDQLSTRLAQNHGAVKADAIGLGRSNAYRTVSGGTCAILGHTAPDKGERRQQKHEQRAEKGPTTHRPETAILHPSSLRLRPRHEGAPGAAVSL